ANEERSGRPVPRAEQHLEEPVEPAARDVGQVEARGPRTADVSNPRHHTTYHRRLEATKLPVRAEARPDERVVEPFDVVHPDGLGVEERPSPSPRGERLPAPDVDRAGDELAAAVVTRDGDRPPRAAVHEVRR